jgi:cytochrome c553
MKKVKQHLEEQRFREIEEYYKANQAPETHTKDFGY